MQRALLTGISGYLGAALARRLLDTGWQVHGIVRATSSRARTGDARLVLHEHDGSTAGMTALVAAAAPDVVFHLASMAMGEHRPDDIEPMLQANLLFGTQLVEAMSLHGATRLVNTGTFWQHYDNAGYNPVSLYAATKEAFEALLRYYAEARFLRVTTLKLFDTYGPDDPRPKLMQLLLAAARSGEALAMSPGGQRIDLVHVDDVVDAYLIAAQRLLDGSEPAAMSNYAVSSGRPLTLKELVAEFERASGLAVPVRWGVRPYRPREVMVPWTHGTALPGWQPRVGFDQGVAQLLQTR